MRWPWFRPSSAGPNTEPLSTEQRVSALETRMDTLQVDWEDVLDKLAKRAARAAAGKKADLVRVLEAPPPETAPDGQPEALDVNPSKAQLWARLRAKGR